MAVTSPAVVALEGSLYVTGGAILEDGDGIELVQRSVRSRIAIPAIFGLAVCKGSGENRASEPGSGSRLAKIGPKYVQNQENFMFRRALLRAETSVASF
jgi:hypothetical protein